MRPISAAAIALLKATSPVRAAAFSFRPHGRASSSLSLHPSRQHPLLPLPGPPSPRAAPPSDVRAVLLRSSVGRVAFVRHGNTAPAPVDLDRTLTDRGRSQARAAGASYGVGLRPFHPAAALCSSAPRCAETAALFLECSRPKGTDDDEYEASPPIALRPELYDGTMQPEGSRLFRTIGYAPLRDYLERAGAGDAEAARSVLGRYARASLDAVRDAVAGGDDGAVREGGGTATTTLLFFAHAIYLPAAALALAAGADCDGLDSILDTDTREAEGYCVDVDARTVSLLRRPGN